AGFSLRSHTRLQRGANDPPPDGITETPSSSVCFLLRLGFHSERTFLARECSRARRSFPFGVGRGARSLVAPRMQSNVRRASYLRAGSWAGWTHAEKMGKHVEVHVDLLLEAGHQNARRGDWAI